MVKGTPFVREIATDNLCGWKQVFTIEPANRQWIGLVVSNDDKLYVVNKAGNTQLVGIDTYDPQSMQITITGDLFHWTITEYTATDARYYAVNANTFEPVACAIVPDAPLPLSQQIERWILPVRLRFTSWRTQLIAPNINDD